MSSICVLFRLLSLALAAGGTEDHDGKCARAFDAFTKEYDRVYASPEERDARFSVFKRNYAFIEAENAKGHSYTLALNEFADQTPEEFGKTHLGLTRTNPAANWGNVAHLGTHQNSGRPLVDAVDWTAVGAVTPPKNQLHCGSCWTFASTGALEGAWKIATGQLFSLSEQQLVDCSKDGNMGCKGGSMELAFTYLEKHGVCTEGSYPYEAVDGTCRQSNCTVAIPAGGVQGYKDVPPKDEQALLDAVAQQPVAVAIEADQVAFQLYHGGILSKECGVKLDHGVLVVGFGTDNGIDYWKVKNSWGPAWGEDGYVRIARGVPEDGECGINDAATYPVVGKPGDTTAIVV